MILAIHISGYYNERIKATLTNPQNGINFPTQSNKHSETLNMLYTTQYVNQSLIDSTFS
jgi:hypothetical protein